jgi:hypothetical protein
MTRQGQDARHTSGGRGAVQEPAPCPVEAVIGAVIETAVGAVHPGVG